MLFMLLFIFEAENRRPFFIREGLVYIFDVSEAPLVGWDSFIPSLRDITCEWRINTCLGEASKHEGRGGDTRNVGDT